MSRTRDLLDLLGVAEPVILAPMAGGPGTPELVAAVSNAGGLGSLGAAYLTPRAIVEAVATIRSLTGRPFAVNLFVGGIEEREVDPAAMLALMAPLHERFGIAPPRAPVRRPNPFDAQIDAVLACDAPIVSVTFGVPGPTQMQRLLDGGRIVIGTATTVGEALFCEAAGCHAVCAQGAEAGAHRGTFMSPFETAMVGTIALVPQVCDAVAVPVIAAGGIVDRRGAAAARALGASAVQCGTAFLDTREAGTSAPHRHALAAAAGDETVVTRAFSGRPARGLANAFSRAVDARPDAILPFPLQNDLTQALRAAARANNDAEYVNLWAGQAVAMMTHGRPAAEVVSELAAGFRA